MVMVLSAILVSNPPEHYQAAFDLIVTLLCFPCLILAGASSAPTGLLARLFTWLGTASYGIYVLQVPIYELAYRASSHLGISTLIDPPWIFGVAFLAVVVAAGVIADKSFDQPVREKLTTLLLKPRPEGSKRVIL